jgi:hypothetical protein
MTDASQKGILYKVTPKDTACSPTLLPQTMGLAPPQNVWTTVSTNWKPKGKGKEKTSRDTKPPGSAVLNGPSLIATSPYSEVTIVPRKEGQTGKEGC